MFMQCKLTSRYLLMLMFLNICSSQISVFVHIDIVMYLVSVIKMMINFCF